MLKPPVPAYPDPTQLLPDERQASPPPVIVDARPPATSIIPAARPSMAAPNPFAVPHAVQDVGPAPPPPVVVRCYVE